MKINFNSTAVYFGTSDYSSSRTVKKSAPRVVNEYYDDSDTFLRNYYGRAQKLMDDGKTKEVFELFGIKCRQLPKNRGLVIDKYQQPNQAVNFFQLGVDEDKLLENVTHIEGNMDLSGSHVTSAKRLKSIGGHLKAEYYNDDVDFSSLESIGTNVDISNSKIESMPKLRYIGGWAHLDNSRISNLDSLEVVKSWLSVAGTPLCDLPSIKYIGRDFTPSGKMTIDTAARIKSKEQNLPFPTHTAG